MQRSTKGLILAVLFVFLVLPGCSTRPRYVDPYESESIERPARSMDEEENVAEKAGKILLVIGAVGVALALIVVPVLFATGELP